MRNPAVVLRAVVVLAEVLMEAKKAQEQGQMERLPSGEE
jgi:hypothetical protein